MSLFNRPGTFGVDDYNYLHDFNFNRTLTTYRDIERFCEHKNRINLWLDKRNNSKNTRQLNVTQSLEGHYILVVR